MATAAKDECERALQLAQLIAQDIVARIKDECTDKGHSNATTLTVFGYLTGVGDTVKKAAAPMGDAGDLLFSLGRSLGELVGASKTDILSL